MKVCELLTDVIDVARRFVTQRSGPRKRLRISRGGRLLPAVEEIVHLVVGADIIVCS